MLVKSVGEDCIKSLTVDPRQVVFFRGVFLRSLSFGHVNKLIKDCSGSWETKIGGGRSQPDSSVNNLEACWPDNSIVDLQGIRKAF